MNRFASQLLLTATALAALAGLAGCRGDPSDDPPVHLQRNMFHQQRYNPQALSDHFHDKRTMRTPEPGTIGTFGAGLLLLLVLRKR